MDIWIDVRGDRFWIDKERLTSYGLPIEVKATAMAAGNRVVSFAFSWPLRRQQLKNTMPEVRV